MSIDKNQVKKVAKLSRISLDDRKLESLSKDLDSILKFVEQLNKLETKNTEPLTSIVDKTLESRKDIIDDGKIKDQILKNSPDKNNEFFIVPKVVE
ncbi:MAG: Asp-tRNA(Asn)/Glu-tRNA(Gln) amidotransferase GatCAB subunit C [Candidatus Pelagibacter sp.]|nr:Asp-tRNA(Asn)/Glu-tRNA(Gln) amidotransferase GatCAB subunit C [Candidatus Pelagibacter sp.]|tara:strand:+ start:5085 stop:5372 length:288 start_codon:yes stop_codon:yes gene_type:complete